jgi:hypothetical protein
MKRRTSDILYREYVRCFLSHKEVTKVVAGLFDYQLRRSGIRAGSNTKQQGEDCEETG